MRFRYASDAYYGCASKVFFRSALYPHFVPDFRFFETHLQGGSDTLLGALVNALFTRFPKAVKNRISDALFSLPESGS
jgi:hypothetical protein